MRTESGIWRHPPNELTLSDSEVHLWKCRITDYETDAEFFYGNLLPVSEKEKADSIRSRKNDIRYVITRGILRSVLSEYLREKPRDIIFEYNEHGKPSIADSLNPFNVKFNLSHSKDMVLYAVAKNKEVGVDVEYMRDVNSAEKILARFFSHEQRDFYNAQSEEMKRITFFRLWTRREAYGKATGRGFSIPADDCGIPFMRDDGNLTCGKAGHIVSGKWSIYDMAEEDNYVSAMAVEGRNHRIKRFKPRKYIHKTGDS